MFIHGRALRLSTVPKSQDGLRRVNAEIWLQHNSYPVLGILMLRNTHADRSSFRYSFKAQIRRNGAHRPLHICQTPQFS
jgi:hypothetical protein